MTDQVAFWNGPAAERWVREQENLDRMLHPFGEAALAAARVSPGEAVIDVGCGCGVTSLAMASKVGPRGRVLGLDLSLPMLERAKQRAGTSANVTFSQGDAGRVPLERGAFDLIFSRFGVMFFDDPPAAFANLRAALRPDGRLTFACWMSLELNPWAKVPFDAAASVLGAPEPDPPDSPGPFALCDADRVRGILDRAGFVDVDVRRFETVLRFGSSGSMKAAVDDMVRLGPVARLLVNRDDADVARARAAIETVLPAYRTAAGDVGLPSAVWIVTARNEKS